MSTIRVIGRENIQKVFTVTAALRAVESAYAGKSAGTGRVWPMVFHEFDPGHADLDIKSGDLESAGVYGLKVVSWYDSNAEKALAKVQNEPVIAQPTRAPCRSVTFLTPLSLIHI